uniref:Uncharacterized protein n=1 Tax=Globisporangium ultimum (strain ATCC 200006 / CBS 805.95 / DAOM BR144) TaxID=431595 RepID=K3WPH9_GLOUD
MLIAETLVASAQCSQLHQLNLSRNLELRSVVKYQELIRSGACPSLVSLQLGYAQTYVEGRAFVKDTLARMSVEELRRRKQALFESRLTALQLWNDEKARRDVARCKRQCQLLRAQYDHMESEADRALRRRKRIRKSTHLCIHQEIQQLKQAHQHRVICKALQASQ